MSSPPEQVKRLGFCPVTGLQLFEFLVQFPVDHPLAGEPIRLGKPFPHAVRAAVILTSGEHTMLSFAQAGIDQLLAGEASWSALHRAMLKGIMREVQTKVLRSGKVTPEKEQKAVRQNLVRLANSPPIGILHTWPWTEIRRETANA